MILITACFPIESKWITRRPGVCVVRTAIGERSRTTLEGLDSEMSEPSHIIAAGFSGGIDPRIRRGDLFLARSVRHQGEEIHIDPELLGRAQAALSAGSADLHVGLCESADHVLGSDEKRTLAEDGLAAVDMESGPIGRWAAERGIPFLALRVVLDPAESDLPFPVDRPLWSSAFRHPVSAVRVARHALGAGRVLGTAVDSVIDALRRGSNA